MCLTQAVSPRLIRKPAALSHLSNKQFNEADAQSTEQQTCHRYEETYRKLVPLEEFELPETHDTFMSQL